MSPPCCRHAGRLAQNPAIWFYVRRLGAVSGRAPDRREARLDGTLKHQSGQGSNPRPQHYNRGLITHRPSAQWSWSGTIWRAAFKHMLQVFHRRTPRYKFGLFGESIGELHVFVCCVSHPLPAHVDKRKGWFSNQSGVNVHVLKGFRPTPIMPPPHPQGTDTAQNRASIFPRSLSEPGAL